MLPLVERQFVETTALSNLGRLVIPDFWAMPWSGDRGVVLAAAALADGADRPRRGGTWSRTVPFGFAATAAPSTPLPSTDCSAALVPHDSPGGLTVEIGVAVVENQPDR